MSNDLLDIIDEQNKILTEVKKVENDYISIAQKIKIIPLGEENISIHLFYFSEMIKLKQNIEKLATKSNQITQQLHNNIKNE